MIEGGKQLAGQLLLFLELKHDRLDLVLVDQAPFEQDIAEEAVFAAAEVVLDLVHDRRLNFVDSHEPFEYGDRPEAVTPTASYV